MPLIEKINSSGQNPDSVKLQEELIVEVLTFLEKKIPRHILRGIPYRLLIKYITLGVLKLIKAEIGEEDEKAFNIITRIVKNSFSTAMLSFNPAESTLPTEISEPIEETSEFSDTITDSSDAISENSDTSSEPIPLPTTTFVIPEDEPEIAEKKTKQDKSVEISPVEASPQFAPQITASIMDMRTIRCPVPAPLDVAFQHDLRE